MEESKLNCKWRCNVFHDLYVEIAVDRFVHAENAYIELNKQENDSPNGRTYELVTEIRKDCIETICFVIMALESFINTFAASYISEHFAKTIERLDIPGKWIVTMQVGKGIELKKGEAPVQRIATSIKYRNSFVHSKSNTIAVCEECGVIQIPEMNLYKDYMNPAYEALKALEDASKWIKKNWGNDTLNISADEIHKKVNGKFKTIENSWIFQEPSVMV